MQLQSPSNYHLLLGIKWKILPYPAYAATFKHHSDILQQIIILWVIADGLALLEGVYICNGYCEVLQKVSAEKVVHWRFQLTSLEDRDYLH